LHGDSDKYGDNCQANNGAANAAGVHFALLGPRAGVAKNGDVYFASTRHLIHKISASTGLMTISQDTLAERHEGQPAAEANRMVDPTPGGGQRPRRHCRCGRNVSFADSVNEVFDVNTAASSPQSREYPEPSRTVALQRRLGSRPTQPRSIPPEDVRGRCQRQPLIADPVE